MTKSKEEMAREYAHKAGNYLPTDGSGYNVRRDAFLAGYDARQVEVDGLLSRNQELRFCDESNAIIHAQEKQIQELKKELDEQCRLNGSGASRELALMAEVQELKKFKELAKGPLDALNTYLWCVGVEKSRGKGVVSTKEALNDVAKAYYLFMDLVSKESKDGK